MKKSLLCLTAIGILFAACDKKPDAEAKPEAKPAAAPAAPRHAYAAPDSFKAGLDKVYQGYANIESALAHDDFEGAKAAFGTMHGILHVIQTEGLDSAAKSAWDSLEASFMGVLHPMASSPDIAGMRDHFIDFTPLMVEALDNFGAGTQGKAFLFHCPMARNNQGADWLQRDSVLVNPYFGNTMPACGSLVRKVDLL